MNKKSKTVVAKSMTDIAYEILSKRKVSIQFKKLWEYVKKETKASKDQVGQFYNDLSLDARFVSLKDNRWDLKTRRKFNESHVELSDIEIEEDESEEIEEETEESPLSNSETEEDY